MIIKKMNNSITSVEPLLRSGLLHFSIVLLLAVFPACNDDDEGPNTIVDQKPLSAKHQYFLEVAFGNEFSGGYSNIRKWDMDLKVFVPEKQYDYLNDELDRILSQLNPLLTNIEIQLVTTREEANYIIYFGDRNTYVSTYEPQAVNLVENNWGLFWIYWDGNFSIYQGSMYVDVVRTLDQDCQKHLLREELTQSLGLMDDSFEYPSSIFYQNWTCGTEYAAIDKAIIELLHDPKITSGMSRAAVIEYLRSLEAA